MSPVNEEVVLAIGDLVLPFLSTHSWFLMEVFISRIEFAFGILKERACYSRSYLFHFIFVTELFV